VNPRASSSSSACMASSIEKIRRTSEKLEKLNQAKEQIEKIQREIDEMKEQ
jgi:Asp/Glu/hydantoin racemase